MKVDIISRETIKPFISCCSKTYKLSLLDQLAPLFYIPIILFYSAPDQSRDELNRNAIYDQLKRSLSETLTILYPLAGGTKGDSPSVEMADEGALFLRAQVNGIVLSEFLENPKMDLVQKLFPIDPFSVGLEITNATAIQLNMFACGGLGIGVCISHKIADGATLSTFLSTWAATARGACEIVAPFFDTATMFPPRDVHLPMPNFLIKTEEKVITRRFVFDPPGLASLRAEASKNSSIDKPTLVEAVTALICKVATEARLKITKKHISSIAISHAVNLRGRASPPLPENSFGNIWRFANAQIENRNGGNGIELHALMRELRKAIRKVDSGYVKKLQSKDGLYYGCKEVEEVNKLISEEEGESYGFSSWVRFSFYETDFGWGKPIWACIGSVPLKNAFLLMGSRTGGMEAWVTLEEQVMAKFQQDPLLLQFASVLSS